MAFPLTDAEHAQIKSRIDSQEELIVAAAIRYKSWVIMVERPGRHGNCINLMHSLGLDHADQGFVTNRGRFVDRQEAASIVGSSGQTTIRDNVNGNLFSEDVWNDWDITPIAPVRAEDVF